MRGKLEENLNPADWNHLKRICRQAWYHTLFKIEIQRKALRSQVFGILRPRLQQWLKKLYLLQISENRMFRSLANSEEKEESSDIDATNKHNTDLYVPVKPTQWPIVYGPEYNIGFLGLERLHPFDAGKWGKVYNFLKEDGLIRDDTTIRPKEATEDDLKVVHSKKYINSLKWSIEVAGITEVPPVAILPNFIVQRKVLRPFRYQTGGTILAAKLAMERGWGINIGGGFHHCSSERGGGFCAYADITLAIKFLFDRDPSVKKAMIIDLDAHQGNGHERDFMDDTNVYIMDVYNRAIYPHDGYAKRAIKRKIELTSYTGDSEYLDLVRRHVEGALNEFSPDIIVYNAGTDVLEGDPLGHLSITPEGIIERDQIVFESANRRNIPIMMVTSGGYQRTTARIIADSIKNLKTQKLISCEEAENAPKPVAENQASHGIPRSQSESGLFAKLRSYCFSKSPTQESVPAPLDTNVMSIPNLSSTKSASDLNLPTQTQSQTNTEESDIDFLARKSEESFVESLGIDFTAKNSLNRVTEKELDNETVTASAVLHIPVDDNHKRSDSEQQSEHDFDKVVKYDLFKDITFGDTNNKNKGAEPETGNSSVSITDNQLGERYTEQDHSKLNESETPEGVFADTVVDKMVSDEPDFRLTATLSEDSNSEISLEATSSDVYNNNVCVQATGEVAVVTQETSHLHHLGTLETNQPRALEGELSDNEWSDFVEYCPDKDRCDKI